MGKPLDKQVGGCHYKKLKYQPVEFVTKNNLAFITGNIIKYITRYKSKNGEEDLRKAVHYCEFAISMDVKESHPFEENEFTRFIFQFEEEFIRQCLLLLFCNFHEALIKLLTNKIKEIENEVV